MVYGLENTKCDVCEANAKNASSTIADKVGCLLTGGLGGGGSLLKQQDPPINFGCIASVLSRVLTAVGGLLIQPGRTRVSEPYPLSFFSIVKHKRDLIDGDLGYYMHDILSSTGNGIQVGYMERNMGSGPQTSPICELDVEQDMKWHISALVDE